MRSAQWAPLVDKQWPSDESDSHWTPRLKGIADVIADNRTTATIRADELQPGDVVVYGGHRHRIARVDRRDGWAWPIAADHSGWAIALDNKLIDVHRSAA